MLNLQIRSSKKLREITTFASTCSRLKSFGQIRLFCPLKLLRCRSTKCNLSFQKTRRCRFEQRKRCRAFRVFIQIMLITGEPTPRGRQLFMNLKVKHVFALCKTLAVICSTLAKAPCWGGTLVMAKVESAEDILP